MDRSYLLRSEFRNKKWKRCSKQLALSFIWTNKICFPPKTGRIHVIHRFHRLWPIQVSLWSEFTDSEIILHVSLYLCECVPCAPTHLPLMVNGNDFRGRSGSLEWGWVCVRGWRPFKLHTELLLRAAWLLAAVPASAQARLAATAVWAGHETVTQLWVTARHVCHRAKCDAFTDFRNKRLIKRLKVRLKHDEFYKTHLRVMNHMYNMFNRLS